MFAPLLILGIVATAVVGWVANVVKLVFLPWDAVTFEAIVRLVGVPIVLVGAIAGYL